jgi:hypothetical protein
MGTMSSIALDLKLRKDVAINRTVFFYLMLTDQSLPPVFLLKPEDPIIGRKVDTQPSGKRK